MKSLMTIAALALATACAAQARTEPETPPRAAIAAPAAIADVHCDIRATRTAHGVRLEAIAHADRAVQGAYDFVITARGSGGSSDISQGGAFDVAAGRSATVGSAEISSARYRAVLTLRDVNGDDLCRLER